MRTATMPSERQETPASCPAGLLQWWLAPVLDREQADPKPRCCLKPHRSRHMAPFVYTMFGPTTGHFIACKVQTLSFCILIPLVSDGKKKHLSYHEMSGGMDYCELISTCCIVGLLFQSGNCAQCRSHTDFMGLSSGKGVSWNPHPPKCTLDGQRLELWPFLVNCLLLLLYSFF